MKQSRIEGGLEASTRHPLAWKEPSFYDKEALFTELERVFDICHGCRRCFNLCNAFPTLFDLVDTASTMEVDGVDKGDFWQVVDQCYLCDMCYMAKCPYVPPHEWNVDFPHLMLRAKAVSFKEKGGKLRDHFLASTDTVGVICATPGIDKMVNSVNQWAPARRLLETTLGVHREAWLPPYDTSAPSSPMSTTHEVQAGHKTSGRVVIFSTCYGRYNERHIVDDLEAVFLHNGVEVMRLESEVCCGMPKLELGALEGVEKLKAKNIPKLAQLVAQGWDIVAPVPSCVLMFKQELPLMFHEETSVLAVQERFFDPFEYLELRYQAGLLRTDFKVSLGKVDYHVACHLRVQNMGLKTRDILNLIPDTELIPMERCSGHDGTYAVKVEFNSIANKIVQPIVQRFNQSDAAYYSSDCPMAGHHIGHVMGRSQGSAPPSHLNTPTHPITLLRLAYEL